MRAEHPKPVGSLASRPPHWCARPTDTPPFERKNSSARRCSPFCRRRVRHRISRTPVLVRIPQHLPRSRWRPPALRAACPTIRRSRVPNGSARLTAPRRSHTVVVFSSASCGPSPLLRHCRRCCVRRDHRHALPPAARSTAPLMITCQFRHTRAAMPAQFSSHFRTYTLISIGSVHHLASWCCSTLTIPLKATIGGL